MQASARSVCWVALALATVSAIFLAPLVPWLILAAWLAGLVRPLQRKLAARLGARPRLAAGITTVLVFAVAVPVALGLVSLAIDTYELLVSLAKSERGKALLEQLAARGDHPASSYEMIASHGGHAWSIAAKIAGTTTRFVIGTFVLVAGVYAILVDGRRWYAWMEDHAPIPRDAFHRLAAAFDETGRGLFVGVIGSGLLQAVLATIGYLVLGISHALALGLLTLVMSIVPAFGTALVWAPVAIGLALDGRTVAALVLAAYGLIVVSTIDNLARPFLARRGRLQLPGYLVMVAMFGGVATLGGWGLLLAPLAVRLAKEALALLAER